MKRILFPVLLIVTLLAGGLVAFAIWRSSPGTAQDYFQSGKESYDKADYSTAAIYFQNALQKDDRNRDARFFLALSYLNQGDSNSAVKQLRSLLEYKPNDKEANLLLGNLFLRAGGTSEFFREAERIAKKLLDADKNDVEALVLQGNAQAGLKDYEGSLKSFKDAVNLDPRNSSAFISMGTTQAIQKNYAEAEQAFLKARELDPKNKSALVSLASYYRVVNKPEQAEEVYKDAIARYPSDPGVYGQLAQMYFQLGRIDDATKLLRDMQAKNPKDISPGLMLSDLYLVRNQTKDARQVLLDLKTQDPKNLAVAAKLAASFIGDDPARARVEVDQILKDHPKDPMGLMLLGELQFLSGQYDEARATLSEPQAANSTIPEVQFFLGNIALKKGQPDVALDYFQKSLNLNPTYVAARAALAQALLDKGRPEDARVEINKIIENNRDYMPARLVNASIYRSEKKYAESEQELNALLKEHPSDPDIYQQMALTDLARGKAADAERNFLKAAELQPESIDRLRQVVQFYVQQKQVEKAIQKINAVPDDKKIAAHFELLGAVYAGAGKIPEAEAAFKKAMEKDPRSSGDAALATLYAQSGRLEESLQKLDEVIKKNPTSAAAYATKGMIYEDQRKMAEAKENYKRALELDSTSDIAANNLAYILADEGKELDTALTWAQGVKKRQPEHPGIADTLGWVYYKLGNNIQARDQLLLAVSKDPANPTFQYHLGMIYKAANQPKEAADALRKAAGSPRDFKDKALAQAALKEVTR